MTYGAPAEYVERERARAHQSRAKAANKAPADWRGWLATLFPSYTRAPFAQRHIDAWEWAWGMQPEVRPSPFVGIWDRGGGKSTTAELIVVALGARQIRRYCLYTCMTQEQADDHVANIAALLESTAFSTAYPQMSARMLGKFGSSKGWRRNRLRTASGFTVDALGLDTAARGIKIEDQRPDLIIIDDIDSEDDSTETTAKKLSRLTRKVLPVGIAHTAHMAIQNLVHPDSIFAQLADGRADMLKDRILSGPHPALLNAVYDEARSRIVSGIPTWAGRDLDACQQFVTTWGLDAFKAECQHEPIALTGRYLPSMGLWDACAVVLPPLSPHEPCVLAMDAGESNDTFATGLLSAHPAVPSGVAVRYARAYVPDGTALDFDEIEIDVRELGQHFAIQELAYDPFLLGQFIRRLARPATLYRKAALTVPLVFPAFPAPCVPFPQGQARLEADKGLYDLVAERRWGHNGDPELRSHLDNANVKKSADGRQWRIVKRRYSQKIDLAVMCSMGAARASAVLQLPSAGIFF